MKFNVTQRDINSGATSSPTNCPVARSLRRALGLKENQVSVTGEEISIKSKDYLAPQSVTDFVAIFDARFDVEPFSFSLPIRKRAKKTVSKSVVARVAVQKQEKHEYATV